MVAAAYLVVAGALHIRSKITDVTNATVSLQLLEKLRADEAVVEHVVDESFEVELLMEEPVADVQALWWSAQKEMM